jgi:hypothetical protein
MRCIQFAMVESVTWKARAADHQGSQRGSPKVDLSKRCGGHRQQSTQQAQLVSLVGLVRWASPTAMGVQNRLPEPPHPRCQTADPLWIEALGLCGLGHSNGEPIGSNAVQQRNGNNGK